MSLVETENVSLLRGRPVAQSRMGEATATYRSARAYLFEAMGEVTDERKLRDARGCATHRRVAHPLYGEVGTIYLGHEPGVESDGSGAQSPRLPAQRAGSLR
jgi:hypothetical protein